MPVTSRAHVPTTHAHRYVAELCSRLRERAPAAPEPGLTVELTEAGATIDFGWSRCTLAADDSHITLQAEAEDDQALDQICELIARHLEGHAEQRLSLAWSHHDGPHTDADRRDRMRSFHARMH